MSSKFFLYSLQLIRLTIGTRYVDIKIIVQWTMCLSNVQVTLPVTAYFIWYFNKLLYILAKSINV